MTASAPIGKKLGFFPFAEELRPADTLKVSVPLNDPLLLSGGLPPDFSFSGL